jgi:hypothetical protein
MSIINLSSYIQVSHLPIQAWILKQKQLFRSHACVPLLSPLLNSTSLINEHRQGATSNPPTASEGMAKKLGKAGCILPMLAEWGMRGAFSGICHRGLVCL